ncbi:MAG: hypothetical protein KatS3mg103_1199 [Phycisphaerales bacterium]|nr:MAG: hypothetical protein KatS3mg103_1199 [Phycisphaerales bacterium]
MNSTHDDILRTVSSLNRRRPSLRALRDRLADFERNTLRDPQAWRTLWERWGRRWWPAGLAALLALGFGVYLLVRPTPVPDYATGRIDTLMDFTLLKSEFNALPLERRLELVGLLAERLQGMSSSESLMLAAFAGSIRGKAREQLEENISRLAIDLWDSLAEDYQDVPPEQREQYLAEAFVRFETTLEALGGQVRDRTPEERLERARRQAQRDQQAIQDGRGPPARVVGRMFEVMNNNFGRHASPVERRRGELLMRDMTRFLRGQSVGGGG